MNKIKQFWNWILALDNKPLQDKIAELELKLFEKEKVITQWTIQHEGNVEYINKLKAQKLKLIEEIKLLESEIELLLEKDDLSNLEEQLNTKYPKGFIVYKGRPLPYGKTNVEFPVNVLITPNDFNIVNDLKIWGLYNTGEDMETLIPKIYKKIQQKYYKYEYDKNVWGTSELWEIPFETRAKIKEGRGVDCDSWSHFQMSYYVAAGLPEALGRVVVGMCELGGHSTIYIYSVKDNEWHHLNSTYGRPKSLNSISDYPTHKDAREGKDKLGITKVWFSFNRLFSWYKFEEDIPKELSIK